MRLFTLLCTSLIVVLAACGSDGNNGGDCGDGHVTGSESCDDGNSISGDGCSATCQDEGLCGNGVFDVSSETCDDGNKVSGDGCSSTCQKEGTCGNSAVEAGETCDDGNTASMDGCNGACATEPGYTCTGMPSVCSPDSGGGTCAAPGTIQLVAMGTDLVGDAMGDTTNATNGLAAAACDGDTAGAGNDQIFKFTTTDVRDVIVILAPGPDFDGGIRVMTAPCDATKEVVDQFGTDGCSDSGYPGDPYDGMEGLGYVNLPAGTYYISVDGYGMTDAGPYALQVTASLPTCGDGTLGNIEQCDDGNSTPGDGCTNCKVDSGYNCDTSEPSICQAEGCGDGLIQSPEACDDDNTAPNDGCSATCTVEANYTCDDSEPSVCTMVECGNGIVDGTDECDDNNPNNGDRCSTTCTLEFDTMEAAEPNNTTPQVLTAVNHIVKGTYEDGDVDLYTFTLTATSQVEIETYATIDGNATNYGGYGSTGSFDCLNDTDETKLAIFPAAADTTNDANALAIDDNDGDLFCSYLGVGDATDPTQLAALPAGTYTIRVTPSNGTFAEIVPPGTRYMLDLKIIPMGTGPVAPGAGDLKINEFMAADGGATTTPVGADTNCDGSMTDSNDEFIELVNVTNKTLDLTGVTYSDALGVKFTFAPQSTGSLSLAPGKAVVIWGGGAPQCPGVTNFFTHGTYKSLSLNDTGDTIKIDTAGTSPAVIATTTYTEQPANKGTSQNLSTDASGTTYMLHSAVTGHVGNFSPGKKVDGTAFP